MTTPPSWPSCLLKLPTAEGGSDKYIEGHFVPKYTVPGATGNANAPNFGAVGGSNVKLLN